MIEDLFDTAKEWGFNQLRDTSLSIVESLIALSLLALNPLFPAIATPISSSFRLLVMGIYGLAVCLGGVLVMTNESIQERYSAREIIPRLIAGFLLSYHAPNIIWFIQDLNIDMVAAFTLGDVLGDSETGSDFADLLIIEARSAPISIIDLIIGFLKLIAAFILWLCMLTRNIAWLIVAMFAPIALASHSLPFTEGLAWLWWRMLWACFFSSVGQAALIWAWMHLYDDLDDIEVLVYYSMGPFYMLVLTWVAWRLHKDLFIWAKGSPMRLPGSRVAKAIVGATVGTALFRWNPVGRLGKMALHRFRGWRQGRQPQQIPPVPPPPPGQPGPQPPGPRPRPRPPQPPGPQPLPAPPFNAGDSPDRPPQRPGQGPTSSEQVSGRRVRGELEPAPPGRWKAGRGPERPPEPDGEPDALPPRPVRGELDPVPPGRWETGPARWQAGSSTARSPERTADTAPASESTAWDRLRRSRPRVETIPPPEPAKRPARTSPAPATPADVDQIKRRRRGRRRP